MGDAGDRRVAGPERTRVQVDGDAFGERIAHARA
jgi:hypothetical protein